MLHRLPQPDLLHVFFNRSHVFHKGAIGSQTEAQGVSGKEGADPHEKWQNGNFS